MKLMEEVVDKMKMLHLARKTVKAYSAKIREYVIFTYLHPYYDAWWSGWCRQPAG